jgi:hypothetical protein
MFDQIELGSEFFEGLMAIDARIAQQVQSGACRFCGGRLHRGDYPRKPRGGVIARAAETFRRRFSLCCSEEGCRRRATPPSVRFLGRRVYASAVVIVASAVALLTATASQAMRSTGIAARTTRRWLRWWRGTFPSTEVFVELSGRFLPALSRPRLPASILERLTGTLAARVQSLLRWLLPLTTAT